MGVVGWALGGGGGKKKAIAAKSAAAVASSVAASASASVASVAAAAASSLKAAGEKEVREKVDEATGSVLDEVVAPSAPTPETAPVARGEWDEGVRAGTGVPPSVPTVVVGGARDEL